MSFSRLREHLGEEQRREELRERREEQKQAAEEAREAAAERVLTKLWQKLELTTALEKFRDILYPACNVGVRSGLQQRVICDTDEKFMYGCVWEQKERYHPGRDSYYDTYPVTHCALRLYPGRIELYLGDLFYEAFYLNPFVRNTEAVHRWLDIAVTREKEGKPGRWYMGRRKPGEILGRFIGWGGPRRRSL